MIINPALIFSVNKILLIFLVKFEQVEKLLNDVMFVIIILTNKDNMAFPNHIKEMYLELSNEHVSQFNLPLYFSTHTNKLSYVKNKIKKSSIVQMN